MFLLVKHGKTSRRIEVQDGTTIDELQSVCCKTFSVDRNSFDLSLNGKDPLPAEAAASKEQTTSMLELTKLGIVNGDKLFLIKKIFGNKRQFTMEQFLRSQPVPQSSSSTSNEAESSKADDIATREIETENSLMARDQLNHAPLENQSSVELAGFSTSDNEKALEEEMLIQAVHHKVGKPFFIRGFVPTTSNINIDSRQFLVRESGSTFTSKRTPWYLNESTQDSVPLSLDQLFTETIQHHCTRAQPKLVGISVLCDLLMREEGFERRFVCCSDADDHKQNSSQQQQHQSFIQLHFAAPLSNSANAAAWHCCIILSTIGGSSSRFTVHTGCNFPMTYFNKRLITNESSSTVNEQASLDYLKPFADDHISNGNSTKMFDRYYISHAYSGRVYPSAAAMYRNVREFAVWFKEAVVLPLKALVSYQVLQLPYPSPYSLQTISEQDCLVILTQLPTIRDVIRLCCTCRAWYRFIADGNDGDKEYYWFLWKYFVERDFGKAIVEAEVKKAREISSKAKEENAAETTTITPWKSIYKREFESQKKLQKSRQQFQYCSTNPFRTRGYLPGRPVIQYPHEFRMADYFQQQGRWRQLPRVSGGFER